MAEREHVRVTLGRDGSSKMEVLEGGEGTSCATMTAGLEAALGGKLKGREWTDDRYKTRSERERRRA